MPAPLKESASQKAISLWKGFRTGLGQKEINVRDFIQQELPTIVLDISRIPSSITPLTHQDKFSKGGTYNGRKANPPQFGGTPVFGWILQNVSGHSAQMELEHYQITFQPLLYGVIIAIALTFLLKETGSAVRKPVTIMA